MLNLNGRVIGMDAENTNISGWNILANTFEINLEHS
jgi:hypothetical protein